MKQLKRTNRPVVLTVRGKAEAVVQDAESYQLLLDTAAHGRTRPAHEVFNETRRRHGIPR